MENRVLKSEMVLHGDTLVSLANTLGINRQTLSRKLSGEADFTQTEMNIIREIYDMSDEKFAATFKKEIVIDESKRSSATP